MSAKRRFMRYSCCRLAVCPYEPSGQQDRGQRHRLLPAGENLGSTPRLLMHSFNAVWAKT